jgi:P4 family phage/plasmid primase-like protien
MSKSSIIKINIKSDNNMSKKTLYEFLNEHRVFKGDDKEITHTTLATSDGSPKGKFNILGKETKKEFYNLYKKAIQKGKKVHIVERHCEYGPLIIDIDLKFELDDNGVYRRYNDEHVVKVIELYRTEIEKYFKIKNENKYTAYVFQRDEPYQPLDKEGNLKKGMYKDGFHIIFKEIVSTPDIQFIIRENVLKCAKEMNIFQDIEITNVLSDVFDLCVVKSNGFIMHDGCKPNCLPYKLSKIYDENYEEIKLETLSKKNLQKMFSIRKTEAKKTPMTKDGEDRSMNYNKKKTIKEIKKERKSTIYCIDEVKQLVELLDENRAKSESEWISVGWCLHSIDPENDELLNIWIDFSKKWEEYKDDSECEKRWGSFKNGGMTIGTLKYWAKNDNPVGYALLKSFDLRGFIERSINCTNYDVARVLHEMYKDNFVCVSNRKSIWYEFKNHKWFEIDSGVSLRRRISTNMVDEYIKLIAEYNVKSEIQDGDTDEIVEEKKKYTKIALKLVDLTYQLKTTSFKDNIMKEAKELFYDKDFVNKLDTNLDIIGFENGIYDLKNEEFRDGRPEDYVSLSTLIDYTPFKECDLLIVKEIHTFMGQVFTNIDVKNYTWRFLSSCLQGHNPDEKFHVLTGVGSNGKSRIKDLFVSSFGEYCINFPITLITGKRAKSNAATPEIAQARGKRFGYFDEPGEGEKINTGLMKGLTGNDIIKARALYSEPIEFKPQFKLVLLCNDKPEVPPHDEGTWRRLTVIEFLSKFVDNPNKENKSHFKRDRTLAIKMENWTTTFMSMLIEVFKEYKKIGLSPPKKIQEFTNQYQRTSNMFIDFLETNIEYENVESKEVEKIRLKDLFDDLKTYCDEESVPIPYGFSSKKFGDYIQKTYGKDKIKIKGGKIIGLKYKKDRENDENVNYFE